MNQPEKNTAKDIQQEKTRQNDPGGLMNSKEKFRLLPFCSKLFLYALNYYAEHRVIYVS